MFICNKILDNISNEHLIREYENLRRLYNLAMEFKYYKLLVLRQASIIELYNSVKRYKTKTMKASTLIQELHYYYNSLYSMNDREAVLNIILSVINQMSFRLRSAKVYSREINELYYQKINDFIISKIGDNRLISEYITWTNNIKLLHGGSLFVVDYRGHRYIFHIYKYLYSIIYRLYDSVKINLT